MVIVAFGLVILASLGAVVNDAIPCNDIIDIYTSRYLESAVGHDKCRYTVTVICEKECTTAYVSRKNYNEFMKEYDDYGWTRPFPTRKDLNKLNNPKPWGNPNL